MSDNTTFGVMATYSFGAPKFFAGYEHIKFANPGDPLAPGFDDIGGYKLAFVNNTAYDNNKILQVYWAGFRWQIQKLELIGAYYGYHQNSYATGSHAGCTDNSAGSCSGTENVGLVLGRLPFHQALRHVRWRDVLVRVGRPVERLFDHQQYRSDARRALPVLEFRAALNAFGLMAPLGEP